MIDPEDKLSVQKQSKLLKVSRSSVYYKPQSLSEDELKLMRTIDELHLEHPFAGSRMLRDLLQRDGVRVGRRHMRTAMRRMGIEAIYRKPNTSKPAQCGGPGCSDRFFGFLSGKIIQLVVVAVGM